MSGHLTTSASLATNCKPTLGYTSRSAAAIALKAEGLTWGQVGAKLGITGRQASSLAHRAQQRAQRAVRVIEVPHNVMLDLERAAKKRGVLAGQLAVDLLRIIATDNLFGAMLD